MAGENHRRHLVAELLIAEGIAGLGIAGVAHQIEQIARRGTFVLAGGAALGHQHGHEGRPSLAKPRAGEILRSRPGQRQCQIEEVRPRQPLAILHHEIAQGGAVTVHPEREHRPPGDFERHALHDLAQVERPAIAPFEVSDGFIRHRDHVRNERRHRARREGRRERSALVLPSPPLGDQQTLAKDRP